MNNPVKIGNKEVLASVYLQNDKIMIAMGNWSDKDQIINLNIDWKKLGINAANAQIEVPEIDELQSPVIADLKKLPIPASKGLILIIKDGF